MNVCVGVSQIWLLLGPTRGLNTIEFGWIVSIVQSFIGFYFFLRKYIIAHRSMFLHLIPYILYLMIQVYPGLYGDARTRLFLLFDGKIFIPIYCRALSRISLHGF